MDDIVIFDLEKQSGINDDDAKNIWLIEIRKMRELKEQKRKPSERD